MYLVQMIKSINPIILILLFCLTLTTQAQTKKDKVEKQFLKHADQALNVIAAEAEKLSITGVAIVAYIPGESTKTWASRMKVVGHLTRGGSNLLAIASSKAAEMADTFQNSGSGVREPLKGEFGYQGGVIEKVESGYVLAVFSGASGEQDVAVSQAGLTYLKGAM